ncbi:MAG: hypothetical protein HQK98_06475 [Nitrospirae bacterium]|nr:hypothetical protein [Nitrospirota bacterium]
MEVPKKVSSTDFTGLNRLAEEIANKLKRETSAPLKVIKLVAVLILSDFQIKI